MFCMICFYSSKFAYTVSACCNKTKLTTNNTAIYEKYCSKCYYTLITKH